MASQTTSPCVACNGSGYLGRRGLFELLSVTPALRTALERDASRSELLTLAADSGLMPFAVAAEHVVREGVTSLEEITRVLS
jgi:type II secretory ATPase GspE/PulE/Tfp pilus assembly ATPase PilB-like protein